VSAAFSNAAEARLRINDGTIFMMKPASDFEK